MEPKNSTTTTRSTKNKLKQLEKSITPLESRLHEIRNAKVVEQQWKRVWNKIKEWGMESSG